MFNRRSGRRTFSALLFCAVITSLALVASPANAVSKPKVTIKTSTSSVTANAYVRLSGAVSKNSTGARVTLQRKQGAGKWKSVKSTKVTKKKSYGFSVEVPQGTWYYRAVVAKTKKIKTATSQTKKVTAHQAPSQQIVRILADTNSFRAANGKSALRLSSGMNAVAGRWAKHMHDKGLFIHNPDYATQIPTGWTKAAENIAAGTTYTAVVQGWINSPGHRRNLLGDYTHIGIGYFNGPQGYHTYFVQNFAKY